jgi:hypothetical protein
LADPFLGVIVNFKMDINVKDCYILAVSTSAKEGWIRALLLVQPDFPALEELPDFLAAAQSTTDHSLLVPIIVSEIIGNFVGQNIRKCDEMLDDLEVQTGQHGRQNMQKPSDNILGLDFTKITRILNTVNTVLARSERSLKFTLHILDSCSISTLKLPNAGIDSRVTSFEHESSPFASSRLVF